MTIAQVSAQYGLSQDTLRYYERIGLIPRVGRGKDGKRDYTPEDCKWVEFAKCMRGSGLSIEALTEYVSLFQKGEGTVAARKEILVEQRRQLAARMEAMQATLNRLDGKIARYEERVLKAEQNLIVPQEAQDTAPL